MAVLNLLKINSLLELAKIDIAKTIVKPLVDSGLLIYDATSDYREKRAEYKSTLIEIPTLGATDINQFKKHLKKSGLVVELQSLNPHIKYRNCLDNQVVKINYKSGSRVKPGTFVIVSYVTSKTIKESKKIHDNLMAERKKRIDNIKNLVTKKK